MDRMDDKLSKLWVEYRESVPDPDASSNFVPRLWQRIEARRSEPLSIFRRLAEVCVMTTLVLALLMSVLTPELEKGSSALAGSYVDAIAAEQTSNYAALLAVDDLL